MDALEVFQIVIPIIPIITLSFFLYFFHLVIKAIYGDTNDKKRTKKFYSFQRKVFYWLLKRHLIEVEIEK